jgi:DNA-binding NarL/FixJ family response regulator
VAIHASAIRVYVVEDHPAMREALGCFLAAAGDMELCGSAASAEEALRDLDEARPEVILLDLSLPRRSGLALLGEIRDRWPVACVVVSGHGEAGYVERALNAGAIGYVLKGKPDEIPLAVRHAARGERFVSASLQAGTGQSTDVGM